MKYTLRTQSIHTPSIINSRELGGYILPDGRKIRKGLLLRGGALHKLSDEDSAILTDKYHLAVDFDFRTEGEIAIAPDKTIEGVKFIWLPAIDPQTEKIAGQSLPSSAYRNLPEYLIENASSPLVQDVARRLYTDMVFNEYTQLQYAAFMQTIVNTPSGAIYWHCSQGKDRTGLGSAFLLCALGADRELIMHDYLISEEFYRDELAAILPNVSTEEEKAVLRTFISVNPEYFEAALNLVDKHYGSLESYIRNALLVGDDDIRILRERYTE